MGLVRKDPRAQSRMRPRWRSSCQSPPHWWECICVCPSCGFLRTEYIVTEEKTWPYRFILPLSLLVILLTLAKSFHWLPCYSFSHSSFLESGFPDESQVCRVLSSGVFCFLIDWLVFLPLLLLALTGKAEDR